MVTMSGGELLPSNTAPKARAGYARRRRPSVILFRILICFTYSRRGGSSSTGESLGLDGDVSKVARRVVHSLPYLTQKRAN